MRHLNFLLFLLLTTLLCCKKKPAANPVALNNQAMKLVPFISNADSSKKALLLLDSATKIDSNYFSGHFNKLMFLDNLKQYDRVIATINNLIRIKPFANDLYLMGALQYEKKGDTITSKEYYQKSLAICNKVLDTMSVANKDYEMLLGNKGINEVMLEKQIKSNETFRKLYNIQTDSFSKTMTLKIMNKSRREVLDSLLNK